MCHCQWWGELRRKSFLGGKSLKTSFWGFFSIMLFFSYSGLWIINSFLVSMMLLCWWWFSMMLLFKKKIYKQHKLSTVTTDINSNCCKSPRCSKGNKEAWHKYRYLWVRLNKELLQRRRKCGVRGIPGGNSQMTLTCFPHKGVSVSSAVHTDSCSVFINMLKSQWQAHLLSALAQAGAVTPFRSN